MNAPAPAGPLAGRRVIELGTMIAAPFATMRPADDLVNLAAGLAGGSSFQEVIDLEQSRAALDPLRDHFLEILQKHGEAL